MLRQWELRSGSRIAFFFYRARYLLRVEIHDCLSYQMEIHVCMTAPTRKCLGACGGYAWLARRCGLVLNLWQLHGGAWVGIGRSIDPFLDGGNMVESYRLAAKTHEI